MGKVLGFVDSRFVDCGLDDSEAGLGQALRFLRFVLRSMRQVLTCLIVGRWFFGSSIFCNVMSGARIY